MGRFMLCLFVCLNFVLFFFLHRSEMTGPDENYPDVDNNAYTMAAASLAIHWARFMACQCQRNEREEVPDEWIQIALYYNLPFDNVKRLHNAFEGFEQSMPFSLFSYLSVS